MKAKPVRQTTNLSKSNLGLGSGKSSMQIKKSKGNLETGQANDIQSIVSPKKSAVLRDIPSARASKALNAKELGNENKLDSNKEVEKVGLDSIENTSIQQTLPFSSQNNLVVAPNPIPQESINKLSGEAEGDEPKLDFEVPVMKAPENSDNIKVVARFRPLNSVEADLMNRGMGGICVKYNRKDGCSITNSVGFTQSFTLDRIFDSTTSQQTLFEESAMPVIDDILKGYNGTIFTYGQSGSGKTHTMYGCSLYDQVLKGIIPRSIEYMFEFINNPKNDKIKFQIKFSMLEIYKENLYDLLNPEISSKDLKIKETKDKQIYVKNLTEEYITNIEEFLLLIDQADQYRVVSETGLNKQSSRSHLLFIIEVLQQLPDGSEKCGKLNLIDLAGSEKVAKTGAVGDTLEEAKKINLSLSTLGNVISSLSSEKDYIPYRDSKLTRILQDSLGGNYKTTLIVACSPHAFNSEETAATLKFALRAKKIKNKVKQNIKKSTEELERIIEDLSLKLTKAKNEIARLKKKIKELPQKVKEEFKLEVIEDEAEPSPDGKYEEDKPILTELTNKSLKLINSTDKTVNDFEIQMSSSHQYYNTCLSDSTRELKTVDLTPMRSFSENKAYNLTTTFKDTLQHINEEKSSIDEDSQSSGRNKGLVKFNMVGLPKEIPLTSLSEKDNEYETDNDFIKSSILKNDLEVKVSTIVHLDTEKEQNSGPNIADDSVNLGESNKEETQRVEANFLKSIPPKRKEGNLSNSKIDNSSYSEKSSSKAEKFMSINPSIMQHITSRTNVRKLEQPIIPESKQSRVEMNLAYKDLMQKLQEKDLLIKKIRAETEKIKSSNVFLKESNIHLKEKLREFQESNEKTNTVDINRVEQLLERLEMAGAQQLEDFKKVYHLRSDTMSQSLIQENIQLKTRLSKVEEEFYSIFKKMKLYENENYISQLVNHPNPANLSNIFSKEEFKDISSISYKSTLRASKSFFKDIIDFFVTKQDFFNSNIYNSNIEDVRDLERFKTNNIKSAFIKFSMLSVYYEKILLDILNKVSLDLKFREAEKKFHEEIKDSFGKIQTMFENYNNVINEFKKLKLEEIVAISHSIQTKTPTVGFKLAKDESNPLFKPKGFVPVGSNIVRKVAKRGTSSKILNFGIGKMKLNGSFLNSELNHFGINSNKQVIDHNTQSLFRNESKTNTAMPINSGEEAKINEADEYRIKVNRHSSFNTDLCSTIHNINPTINVLNIKKEEENAIIESDKSKSKSKKSSSSPSSSSSSSGKVEQQKFQRFNIRAKTVRANAMMQSLAKYNPNSQNHLIEHDNENSMDEAEEENKKTIPVGALSSPNRRETIKMVASSRRSNIIPQSIIVKEDLNENAGSSKTEEGDLFKSTDTLVKCDDIDLNAPTLIQILESNKKETEIRPKNLSPTIKRLQLAERGIGGNAPCAVDNLRRKNRQETIKALGLKSSFFNKQIINNEQKSFMNSFIGGDNNGQEDYLKEIKQLKNEISMYKTYIQNINDKLEGEQKLKINLESIFKDHEERNKQIYKTEIDNIHECFEVYRGFYEEELMSRKAIISDLSSIIDDILLNSNNPLKNYVNRSAMTNNNINLNVNIINNTLMDDNLSILNFQKPKSVFRNAKIANNSCLTGHITAGSDILSPIHHSKTNSLGEYYLNRKAKACCQEEKEKLKSIFFDESGSATKKFDYLKLSVKNKNLEISYGNGLDCKNKGKCPLTRTLKLGPTGDSCAEVGEESFINDL